MDLGAVLIFAGVMIGGSVLGMLLSIARPRDEETAAMHRRQARRAVGWLQHRRQPGRARMQAGPDLGPHA